MKDPKIILTQKIYEAISGSTYPTFSIVPNDESFPYVYIQPPTLSYLDFKDTFRQLGTSNILIHSGFWNKTSLYDYYTEIEKIKNYLKPTKTSTLDLNPNFEMVYLKLENEDTVELFNENNRTLITTLTYQFEIFEITTEIVIPDIVTLYYKFDGTIIASPPIESYFKFDQQIVESIKLIKINKIDRFEDDQSYYLNKIKEGTILSVYNNADYRKFIVFYVFSSSDKGTYYELSVAEINYSNNFMTNVIKNNELGDIIIVF